MKATVLQILFYFFATVLTTTSAYTKYDTHYSKFSSYTQLQDSILFPLSSEGINIQNNTDSSFLFISREIVRSPKYNFIIEFRDLHPESTQNFFVSDEAGKKTRVEAPEVGIVFRCNDDKTEYYVIKLNFFNTDYGYDHIDSRKARLVLAKYSNGRTEVINEKIISKGIDFKGRYNALRIEDYNGDIRIAIGRDEFTTVMQYVLPQSEVEKLRVGFVATPAAKLQLRKTILRYDDTELYPETTVWNVETLAQHFSRSHDKYEGFWEYLDREFDERIAQYGGKYRIALVKTEEGYDIIYISGAIVRSSVWTTGMLKGRITKTIFQDLYRASWYDTAGRIIDDDVFASFESGVILAVKFPVINSQMRFSKILYNDPR